MDYTVCVFFIYYIFVFFFCCSLFSLPFWKVHLACADLPQVITNFVQKSQLLRTVHDVFVVVAIALKPSWSSKQFPQIIIGTWNVQHRFGKCHEYHLLFSDVLHLRFAAIYSRLFSFWHVQCLFVLFLSRIKWTRLKCYYLSLLLKSLSFSRAHTRCCNGSKITRNNRKHDTIYFFFSLLFLSICVIIYIEYIYIYI